MTITASQVLGFDERDLAPWNDRVLLHRDVIAPLRELVAKAAHAGFDLQIASGYRSFDRQLAIWNRKACGSTAILDDCGQPLDCTDFDPWQTAQAILRWSALPGCSRHHWGTDFDIWDASAVDEDYQLQLTVEETENQFAPFYGWLAEELPKTPFYRPYSVDLGGVAVEPWHLSYAPLSSEYLNRFDLADLTLAIQTSDLQLKESVLRNLESIAQRYVFSITSPTARAIV